MKGLLKALVSAILVVVVLFAVYLAALYFTFHSAEEKAEKTCALATVGSKYADFHDAASKAGLAERAPVVTDLGDGDAKYDFMFAHMAFSVNSCEIHVKGGVITKKEVILDAG